MAKKAIQDVGGPMDEADDIFRESVADLVLNIIKDNFKGNSRLSSYFYKICQNKTISIIKKRKALQLMDIEDAHKIQAENQNKWLIEEEKKDQQAIVDEILELVGYPCNMIILLDTMGYQNDVIALRIGFKTADSVKSKLYNCRKKLREIIESNPSRYKKL